LISTNKKKFRTEGKGKRKGKGKGRVKKVSEEKIKM
jgi:hypothetical protein